MYVMCPLSYRRWATIIVCATLKFSLWAASCCRVLVVKGAGTRTMGFVCMSSMAKVAVRQWSRNCSVSSLVEKRWFSSACTGTPLGSTKVAVTR